MTSLRRARSRVARRSFVAACCCALLPLLPVPEFWITLANYIGLYTLVVSAWCC